MRVFLAAGIMVYPGLFISVESRLPSRAQPIQLPGLCEPVSRNSVVPGLVGHVWMVNLRVRNDLVGRDRVEFSERPEVKPIVFLSSVTYSDELVPDITSLRRTPNQL
jgi:hypothetical protein